MTAVFLSVAGQDDNLGDAVLRRGLVNAVRAGHAETHHIHVGPASDSYLSALGLDPADVLYRDATDWFRAMDSSVVRRRTVVGYNAGEVQVTGTRAHLGGRAALRALTSRLCGGGTFHTGVGIRDPRAGRPATLPFALRLSAPVTWRDEESRACVGVGRVVPDWAFVHENERSSNSSEPRRLLALSLRGDRDTPSDSWLNLVREFAERRQLRIVVFSQVRRDNERADWVGRELRADADTWGNEQDHAAREHAARSLYSQASFVVSDRLHALVIGATQGAFPLALAPGSAEKLRRTLAPAGLGFSAVDRASSEDRDALERVASRAHELPSRVQGARRAVQEVAAEIAALIIGQRKARP